MKEGKVPCPYCKGKKVEEFYLDNILMTRECLSCDDNGMVWWIEAIIQPQSYPWGYVREVAKKKDYQESLTYKVVHLKKQI